MAPQIITDCGNFTLDFKQLGIEAHFLDTSVGGGFGWHPQVLESVLLDNPLKACAPFPITLFPSSQLPMNVESQQ